jgi:hypothetical protein
MIYETFKSFLIVSEIEEQLCHNEQKLLQMVRQ